MKKTYKIKDKNDLKLLNHFLQFKIFDSYSYTSFGDLVMLFYTEKNKTKQVLVINVLDISLIQKVIAIIERELRFRYGKRKKYKI